MTLRLLLFLLVVFLVADWLVVVDVAVAAGCMSQRGEKLSVCLSLIYLFIFC